MPVPDPRQDRIAEIVKPQRIVPTTMEFVDIAGLVAGASKGEGLGNQFLANIRETDAIAHVVRCFADDNVIHVANRIDPVNDIEVINTELALADLDSAEQPAATRDALRQGRRQGRDPAKGPAGETGPAPGPGAPGARAGALDDEKATLREFNLLTAKPTMYIANVAEDGFENNPHLDAVQTFAAAEGAMVVPICNKLESEIAELEEDERAEFLAELGFEEPGLNRVIRTGYRLLDLQTYFTAGVKEVRAWTVRVGAKAPEAAGVIHTDFQKGFIRAEVIAYDDFMQYKGEQGAKDAGKWRLEGKEYVVQDGDVVHFRFNV